jgi:chromosome partitioning protein
MSYVIASIAQKGGVGKSSLAQLVAHGYAAEKYSVLLADMDSNQTSSVVWNKTRQENGIAPDITVQNFRSVLEASKAAADFDLTVFDGAPHATAQTLEIAQLSDLILLPVGASKYDLDPQIILAHELVGKGINKDRILFILCRVVATEKERQDVADYVAQTPFRLLPSFLEEKTGYRQAAEQGRAMTETNFKSLNARSLEIFGSITATLLKLIKGKK